MTNFTFTEAQRQDLDALVEMLADDALGSTRESYEQPLPQGYLDAFEAISNNPNCKLIVVKDGDKIIGMSQLDFITYLTYKGGIRAQIEGVRVHEGYRSQGIGHMLFEHMIQLSKERGCHMVQLTTNNQRPDAFRFYENFGFAHSHAGFKLEI